MAAPPAAGRSAAGRLRAGVAEARARIAAGERPAYHVVTAPSSDGSVDVTIQELPLIHLYVPDAAGVLDGARLLISRTLAVDPDAFDLRAGTPEGNR
jgi:hypothetical protein